MNVTRTAGSEYSGGRLWVAANDSINQKLFRDFPAAPTQSAPYGGARSGKRTETERLSEDRSAVFIGLSATESCPRLATCASINRAKVGVTPALQHRDPLAVHKPQGDVEKRRVSRELTFVHSAARFFQSSRTGRPPRAPGSGVHHGGDLVTLLA